MFFSRTYEYNLGVSKDEFMNRLIGRHVTIHNLDFEIYEQDYTLCIAPHAEQVTDIKTLPITTVSFKDNDGKTKVIIKSNIRQIDAGGPQLIMIFCLFLLIASVILFITSEDLKITCTFLGISIIIFSTFWLRMKRGYFDYVHKTRDYIKERIK